jgi:hypothetical protein
MFQYKCVVWFDETKGVWLQTTVWFESGGLCETKTDT